MHSTNGTSSRILSRLDGYAIFRAVVAGQVVLQVRNTLQNRLSARLRRVRY